MKAIADLLALELAHRVLNEAIYCQLLFENAPRNSIEFALIGTENSPFFAAHFALIIHGAQSVGGGDVLLIRTRTT